MFYKNKNSQSGSQVQRLRPRLGHHSLRHERAPHSNKYDIDRDERAKDRHKRHLETKMILDLTKPAPPTYFPPRCSVPEKVVKAVNLEALQDYKGSQKVLKEVQWPESTFSRLCWSYSAVTTCQAAFQPFSCSRAPENLFRGNGKVFNGHTDSSFDSIGYGWCRKGLSDAHYAASSVSDALAEKHLDDAAIDQAVNEHLIFDEPMGDLYASGPYRVEIAKVDGGKALKTARDRGQS